MENNNKSPEVEAKKKNRILLITSWIIGVIFGIAGMAQIIDDPLTGLLLVILSLIIIPFTGEKINEKLGNRLSKKIIIIFSAIILIVVGIFTNNNTTIKEKPVEQKPAAEKVSSFVTIGETGYLRLPNTKDPEQMICLGPTKESYRQIMRAISAKDILGIIEVGGFCVGNGAKVQVIDVSFSMDKVRILEGVREIDQNVLLKSGWVDAEFVAKN